MENENQSCLEKYVTTKEDQISVNWKLIAKEEKKIKKDETDDIFRYLRYYGILKYQKAKGSFYLSGAGLNLGPIENGLIIHNFAKKEDAKEYLNAKYKGSMYSITIEKV